MRVRYFHAPPARRVPYYYSRQRSRNFFLAGYSGQRLSTWFPFIKRLYFQQLLLWGGVRILVLIVLDSEFTSIAQANLVFINDLPDLNLYCPW